MTALEIHEMLHAFSIFKKKGMPEAIRLFPEYQVFIDTHKTKTFRQLEREMMGVLKKSSPIIARKKSAKAFRMPGNILGSQKHAR